MEKEIGGYAMNKEILNKAFEEIEDFADKLGENCYDAILEDDNTTYDIAKGIITVFSNFCNTEKEFEIADLMLIAVCGYGFETLVKRIKELYEEGYVWG